MDNTKTLSATTPNNFRSAIAIILMLILLAAEILFISQTFDAYLLFKREDLSSWQEIFGQFGRLAKILTLTIVLVAVQIRAGLPGYWRQLMDGFSIKKMLLMLIPHALSYAALLYFCTRLFTQLDQPVESMDFFGWLIAAALTFLFWLLGLSRFNFATRLIHAERKPIFIAIAISALVWLFTTETASLWGPLSDWTFTLSSMWLALFNPDLVSSYPQDKVLGLGDFLVNIAEPCSGYEGIGLITAFIGIYLYLHKSEFRFPRSLLLFPLGIVVIWVLNSLRISLLVAMGYFWSPAVAVGGFHSQAGWIMFILTSLLLLWVAGNIGYFRQPTTNEVKPKAANVPVATLMPLIALLAVSIVTGAFISDFDWLYPLRVVVVAIVIAVYWRKLDLLPYRLHWEPIAAGILVTLLWIVLVPQDMTYNESFQATLDGASTGVAWGWLVIRFLGAAVTVPIAEELAFRAYLLGRLSKGEVLVRGELKVTWVAVAISSLAFGLLHGAWIAGTVAGLIYAIVRMRSTSISAPIVAHGVTNALLFGVALVTGNWGLI